MDKTRLWFCLHHCSQYPCSSHLWNPDFGSDRQRPADSPRIKPAPRTILLFHFQKLLYRREAVAEPACCRADLEDVVWCRGLALPWSRLRGLFTHPGTSGFPGWELSGRSWPDAGSCATGRGAVPPLNQLFPPFPSRLGKQVLSLILRIYCYLLLTL